jgi:RNA polymerase sigma-B factor
LEARSVNATAIRLTDPGTGPALASYAGDSRTRNDLALFARLVDGDRNARAVLVERFMPLARSLARRYEHSGEQFEDLVQVASLALVKAIDRFDASRGIAFSSFAVPTIVGELKRHFRDTAWALHVDRGAQERARRITEARRVVAGRHRRSPTVAELAEYLECSEEEVLDGLQIAEALHTISLDAPRSSHGEVARRLDTLGDEDGRLELIDAQATVFAAAQSLPERDRRILYLRFGEDLTQAEIAERVGVSQMQVSRLLRRSVHRLRELTAPSGERPAQAPA